MENYLKANKMLTKRNPIILADIHYKPTLAHIEHYIYFFFQHNGLKPKEKLKPFKEYGYETELEGSGILFKIANVRIGHKGLDHIDPYFQYGAARLTVLRLYELFLDEEISKATRDNDNTKRSQFQNLKNDVLLENELTTLMIIRHACTEYGKTLIGNTSSMFPIEEGYLSPGLSASFIDYDLILIEADGLDRIYRNSTRKNEMLNCNIFDEWLKTHKQDCSTKLVLSTALNPITPDLNLLKIYRHNYFNLSGKEMMLEWKKLVVGQQVNDSKSTPLRDALQNHGKFKNEQSHKMDEKENQKPEAVKVKSSKPNCIIM